ncbi:MAG: UDP-N-acetylmuramoyl-L-alanyl-D-glutamate--2,6-diaminopimelate ligase, partial [Chlamydiia bacterium]|nr:UDP-N-acetylmuramoyl-L-alanyl-D-glutamate--2,6-diaminopimelate ligase [Chlamydiia bacterium]
SVALIAGVRLEQLPEALLAFEGVPGRLQRVVNSLGLNVFVDFAHNGPALEQLLSAVKNFTKGRVICVFGCGGDRDPLRRQGMAQAAGRFADLSIVTTDNPRSEDPEKIVDEILSHFQQGSHTMRVVDRKEAIFKALEIARPEDVVIIAGRGHEKVQILANKTLEFDDCEVAGEACSSLAKV